jgi:GTP-binding protein EngB required for normal cell division
MPIDMELIENLENAGRRYVIILTKCDKLSSIQITARQAQIKDAVKMCDYCIDVLPYSARTRMGREQLWGIIKRETKQQDTQS